MTADHGTAAEDAANFRDILRHAVRRLLADRWRPDAEGNGDTAGVWRALHEQGVTGLGQDPALIDLPEILAVMEELGRAACPAPMPAAIIANLALGDRSPALAGDPVAFGFGSHDGDSNAGSATLAQGRLSGRLRFTEGTEIAARFLVVAEGPALCLVAADAEGLQVTPTPGLTRPSLADLALHDVAAETFPTDEARIAELRLVARLCLCARALGAAARGFELVLDYAKVRQQFGRVIGAFQAIQHKLANSHIALDAARLQLDAAAEARLANPAAWPLLAKAAVAFCCQTLRQVAFETQHCFGAIGFAEEHEAPRLFRRVQGDLARLGGAAAARRDLAALLFDGDTDPFDAADQAADDPAAAFRQEVREWLAANWSAEDRARTYATPLHDRKWNLPFARKLGDAGWTTLNWPKEAGGRAASPLEQLAFAEELLRAGAPDRPLLAGARILAPEIIAHGSPELRAELLPKLRAGTATACLGYSEPESGSDLASLKTRAVRDGDHFVVNGQKIWTTDGHRASHMILAARTDPDPASRHRGISLFVLPMDTPGITVRKFMALHGEHFCNIFFDDVRIPASHLLGPLNGGWKILSNALASERILMAAYASEVRDLLRRIIADLRARGLAADPVTRDRMAGLAAEVQAARLLSLRAIRLSGGDYAPLVEAAMGKVYASELSQRLTQAAIEIYGAAATLGDEADDVPVSGAIERMLRYSIMMVVGGGTNEIQRNVIAGRALGLPGGH